MTTTDWFAVGVITGAIVISGAPLWLLILSSWLEAVLFGCNEIRATWRGSRR